MATSENGWPLASAAQLEELPWPGPGGNPNDARVLGGPVAIVLRYVGDQFNTRVEPVKRTSTYRNGATIGTSNVYSNHASGTAIDLNGGDHPMGSHNTFTSSQVQMIRRIIAEVGDNVIRWGGDYAGDRVDEMHFEIRPRISLQQVTAAAARITGTAPTPPPEEDDMFSDNDRAMLNDISRKMYETATEVGNTKAGVWTGGSVMIDGAAQKFNYGTLPIVTHNQTLLAQIIRELGEIKKSIAAQ